MATTIYLRVRMVMRYWISTQGATKEDSSSYLMEDQRSKAMQAPSRFSYCKSPIPWLG